MNLKSFNKQYFWGILAFTCIFICLITTNNKREQTLYETTSKKWQAWEKYHKANCKVVEKIYGLSVTGENTAQSNATVYDCVNGIKYRVSDSVTEWAKECTSSKEKKCGTEDKSRFIPQA